MKILTLNPLSAVGKGGGGEVNFRSGLATSFWLLILMKITIFLDLKVFLFENHNWFIGDSFDLK